VAWIVSDLGDMSAASLALIYGLPACAAGVAGSGPVAPVVAGGCVVFAAGNTAIIVYSGKDIVDQIEAIE
jgi:hypothetical protein